MKQLLLFLFSLFFVLEVYGQDTQNFEESACYKEYEKVYSDAVGSTMRAQRTRLNIYHEYGVVLAHQPSSNWGLEEKGLVNAAYLTPTYKPSDLKKVNTTNLFSFIHHKVLKKYPEADPYKTRDLIRRGFVTGEFCSKFLFFNVRKGRKGVANYVKNEYEMDLESGAIAPANVVDTEMSKSDNLPAFSSEVESQSGSTSQNQ